MIVLWIDQAQETFVVSIVFFQVARYWILDAGCWMLDAGCWKKL
jgi:hypothetical protein